MFHVDQAKGSMAYGANPSLHVEDLVRADLEHLRILVQDERGDAIDVSKIPVSYGRSGPLINNRSKSINKNRRRSRRPRLSFDMVQGLKELFNQAKTIDKGNGSGAENANL